MINEFENVLNKPPETFGVYESLLTQLDPIVKRSSQDEDYRQHLANLGNVWQSLKFTLEKLSIIDAEQGVRFVYLRCLRGLFILMRNLSASNQMIPRQLRLHEVATKTFIRVAMYSIKYDEMELSLYMTVTSFLYNITKTDLNLDREIFGSLYPFLEYPIAHLDRSEQLLYPYTLFFLNLTSSDEFLYCLLKPEDKTDILYELLMSFTPGQDPLDYSQSYWAQISTKEQIGPLDAILLRIFTNIVTSESLGPYLQNARSKDYLKFLRLLRISEIVVTSSEKWDKFELTGVMSWCLPLLQQAAQDIEQYFQKNLEEESKAELIHEQLNISLDVISNLSVYDHVQQYILSYNSLESLISLLKTLHENLIRINFYKGVDGSIKSIRATNSKGEKIAGDDQILSRRIDLATNQIRATNFPGSKSFIIEILASLAYEKLVVKDKVRELHGLEVVLSNCVIDDNDPFIKERSIICIKFLLKENAANQDFVAQLEAKKPVPDETLSDLGYQVKIGSDGKISLASKNQNP